MSDIEAEAAQAFEALLAMDQHHVERKELRASGVDSARIASLYGYDFAALLPRLIAHLNGVSDHELLPEGSIPTEWGSNVWDALPEELLAKSGVDGSADLISSNKLADYFVERFESADQSAAWASTNVTPSRVVRDVWSAWWLMSHRSALPTEGQRLADELMISTSRAIALPLARD